MYLNTIDANARASPAKFLLSHRWPWKRQSRTARACEKENVAKRGSRTTHLRNRHVKLLRNSVASDTLRRGEPLSDSGCIANDAFNG